VTEPFDTIIPMGGPPPSPFPATSRYSTVPIVTTEVVPGHPVRHLARRFLPQPERFALLHEHVVNQGERPDTVAAAELGDAEAWWRVADANRVMRPEELTETIGRRLRITLPEGVPGDPGA
jgi:hypothetical protein